MSTLFAGSIDSAHRRFITPSKAGASANSRDPFEVIMDSVTTLLASRRLFSVRTINELNGQIDRAERTVITADLKSSLIAVWKALLGAVDTSTTSHWPARRNTPGYEEVLTRIDQRFALSMDVLRAVVCNGRIQSVTARPENASHRRHVSSPEGLDRGRCLSTSTFHATNEEFQHFGNIPDHRRGHTSHR